MADLLGLDIGAGGVKVCQLKKSAKTYVLTGFAAIDLPPDSIVDGTIVNVDAVVETIQTLVQSQGFKAKKVAVSLSGHANIIRYISMPVMDRRKLDETLYLEAEQYIPFDLSEVQLDFKILTEENLQGEMDVLLVAAKKDVLFLYQDIIRQAGLKLSVIDIDAFALQNTYLSAYGDTVGTAALVDIGANIVNINILHNGQTAFTRDIAHGGVEFTEEIQRAMGISFAEAEAIKLEASLDPEYRASAEGLQDIFREVSEVIARDVCMSLDFFGTTTGSNGVDKIYLTGGPSRLDTFKSILAQKSGAEVIELDPFNNIEIASGLDEDFLAAHRHLAAVSVGLAMRAFDKVVV